MKFTKMVATAAIVFAASALPATAQSVAEAGIKVGTIVYGPQGNEVGKVERIDGEVVTVNTGKNTAALGSNSFAKGVKGPVIGFTRAQLDDAVESARKAAEDKLNAALVVAAPVRSSDGAAIGTVKTINEDGSIEVAQTDRSFVLQREMFAADDQGLMLRITAQQLTEALAKSATAQPAAN